MSPLRRLGSYLLLAGVAAVGWRALQPPDPAKRQVDEPPAEGFELPVEGFGAVGLGIRGPVRITLSRAVEEDERTVAVPRMTIDGRDPGKRGSDLVMDQTVIRALDDSGEDEVYRIESPRAVLALEQGLEGQQRPTPDPSRPWQLEAPKLTMPTPRGLLELEVETASLVPDDRVLEGTGAFTLRSGGMTFSGMDLELDLETGRVDFGEAQPLSWSIPTAQGGLFRGSSDGGGSLTELEDGGRSLELPADELCELQIPAESGLEGLFRCRGLQLKLDPALDGAGWRPRTGRGEAPSSWIGTLADGRECAVFGQDAVLVWDGIPLHGIDMRGPLLASLGEGAGAQEGGWLAAGGGAYLSAGQQDLELYGGVGGQLEQGWFETERYRIGQGRWVAEGNVSLADGQIVTDRFESAENGSQHLDGAVVFRPTPGLAVASPTLTLRAKDELKPGFRQFHAEGGVVAQLELQAEPAVLRSRELDAKGNLDQVDLATLEASGGADGVRLDARHEVRLERGEAVFTGEHFSAHAEDRMELRGSPARAEMPRRGPLGELLGVAVLVAERLVLHEGEVLPVGKPRLRFPAAELGLAGDEVLLEAARMRFAEDGSAGALRGEVRGTGALELVAASAEWLRPEPLEETEQEPHRILTLLPEASERVELRGQLLPATTSGERTESTEEAEETEGAAEGWKFDLQARSMRVDLEDRVGVLDGDAQMSLELAGEGEAAAFPVVAEPAAEPGAAEPNAAEPGALESVETLEFRGRYAEVSTTAGFFLHNATLRQENGAGVGLEGGADRIDWRRRKGGVTLTLTEGRPWLETGGIRAEAAEIVMEKGGPAGEGPVLELTGSAERPARLSLPDGKVLVGQRLRYNFQTRLYDTGSGRLATEDDQP